MPTANEPVCGWATDGRDKYPENHDSGFAGRICMADGNLVWTAVVSDGAGGSMEGLKVSALAVQAFVEAVRRSNLAELSDPAARDAWLRGWTKSLHADAIARFKGGMATFCGAVLLPPAAEGADWRLFSLNVGDSQVWKLTGDGRCMGIVPDAPPNNANVEGRNPIRVVGVAPKGDFCLLDVEDFALPPSGPCWILAGSDGFFGRKKGKDELTIFSPGDLRDVCLDPGVPFQELPVRAIRRSLANAQKLNCASMMDNATVAMIGFRVPATDLANPATGGFGASVRVAAPAPKPAPAPPPAPPPAPKPAAAVLSPDSRRKGVPSVVVGVVGLLCLMAGILGGFLAGPSAPEPAPPVPEPPAPAPATPVPVVRTPVDPASLPSQARCRFCWTHRKELGLRDEDTWHWESQCDRREGTPSDQ